MFYKNFPTCTFISPYTSIWHTRVYNCESYEGDLPGRKNFALPTANFNASSGVYTIPVSGYYQINAIIRIDGVGDFNRVYISVNNTTQAFDTTTSNFILKSGHNSYASGTINTVLKLNINNSLDWYMMNRRTIEDFQHFLNVREDNHKYIEHLLMDRLKVEAKLLEKLEFEIEELKHAINPLFSMFSLRL